jgi:hypothetical protein
MQVCDQCCFTLGKNVEAESVCRLRMRASIFPLHTICRFRIITKWIIPFSCLRSLLLTTPKSDAVSFFDTVSFRSNVKFQDTQASEHCTGFRQRCSIEMTYGWWTGKELGGSCCSLIEVLPRHSIGLILYLIPPHPPCIFPLLSLRVSKG